MSGLTAAELEAVVGVDSGPFAKGLDGMLGMFEGWGGKAAGVLAGAGALGGAAFATGVMGGLDLDEVKGRLQAELGASAQKSEELGEVAGRLYANAYGESLAEVGDAVGIVVSSIKGMRNASDTEVEAMTAKALDFATVFGVDVSKAAMVAGVAIKSGIAKDGAEAFDLLTATMQRVPKELREDVLDATHEYGQFFSSLGIGGEQAFGMLAAASQKGMYGIDKTGDAIKEFTILSTDMSTRTGDAYKMLGLDMGKMTNQILAGGDSARGAFDKIVDGLLAIKDPGEQSAAALALFGTPIEDLNVKDIPKFLQQLDAGAGSLGKFEGAADRAGKAINDNARTNLTVFWRTLKMQLVETIGGQVIPVVNQFARFLATNVGPALEYVAKGADDAGRILSAFAGFVQANETPIKVVAGLIAAVFLPHLAALGVAALINGAKAVAGWVMQQAAALGYAAVHSAVVALTVAGWIWTGVAAVANAVKVVAAWTMQKVAAAGSLAVHAVTVAAMVGGWVLMGVQSMLQAARMAAAWLIAMGPVGWVIAAVIGLVALIIANWDTVKRWTGKVWGWISNFVAASWELIKKWVAAGFGFLVKLFLNFTGPGLIIKHWDRIKATFAAGVEFAKSVVRAGFQLVVSYVRFLASIPGRVWEIFKSAATKASEALAGIITAVKALPGKILSALAGIAGKMHSIGADVVTGIMEGIRSMGSWLVSQLGSWVADKIPGPIRKALGINSPSQVMADEVGRWIPAGIARGIDRNGSVLDRAVGRMGERVAFAPGEAAFAGARAGAAAAVGPASSRRGIRDVNFHGQQGATAREIVEELAHMLRVDEYGGVYAGTGA